MNEGSAQFENPEKPKEVEIEARDWDKLSEGKSSPEQIKEILLELGVSPDQMEEGRIDFIVRFPNDAITRHTLITREDDFGTEEL